MSERYSLRQTPKKTEHHGFVETPRPRGPNRRKSQFAESDGDDSSSATDSLKSRSRATPRRSASMVKEALTNVANGALVNGDGNGVAIGETNGSATNGHATNGHATNGHATNGYATNGHAVNGTVMNGNATNGHATNGHAKTNGKPVEIVDGWAPGMDPKIDYSPHFDFGGSFGVSAMMLLFPVLMWYMWIGATFYDGKPPTPEAGQSFVDFVKAMAGIVYEHAFPSLYAWKIYWTFFLVEGVLYCVLPGWTTYGKPLPHLGGKQLKYHCSGVYAFYTTIFSAGLLHYTGLFKINTIIDEFGPLMSVAICSGFLVAFVAYFSAIARGAQHRMTGYPLYDFFMGAELNPRMFGILDFKMFFEVRLPWYILLGVTSATAARQYENYGYVSGEVAFLVMAHFLYANACSKGEECITTTWDMYYEKWGFMLIFWNLAGVPLSYCHCSIYMANHLDTVTNWGGVYRTPLLVLLFTTYLFVYWVWDTTNSQKNRFRAASRGTGVARKTFPQLPWQTVQNPRTIKTASGDEILADGWYGYARKIHYTCDLFFALTWGLVTGFDSPFPWFYPLFFACMILHRAYRDIQRCRLKYGESWTEYEKMVPYLFIPYVF